MRMRILIYGSTTFAIITVLTAFMGGLAIDGCCFGRIGINSVQISFPASYLEVRRSPYFSRRLPSTPTTTISCSSLHQDLVCRYGGGQLQRDIQIFPVVPFLFAALRRILLRICLILLTCGNRGFISAATISPPFTGKSPGKLNQE
jgi:hypothetical protein